MRGMDLTRRIYAVRPDTPGLPLANPAGLDRALAIATMALSAELVGGMQRVLDLSVEYAKTRKQFGKPIGQFQAVQHQLADTYLETESARSAAYYAAWTLDNRASDWAAAVSIAKMYASDAARNAGTAASRCMAAWASPGKTTFIFTTAASRRARRCWATPPGTASASRPS